MASHAPTPWQASIAAHATGLEPVHVPAWHVSNCVQPFPSLHALPSAFAGFEHTPVDGSHAPATWHESPATHTTGLAPTHAPDWHVSDFVHALPSLHAVPFGRDASAGHVAATPVHVS
jgi:hypothetical protein